MGQHELMLKTLRNNKQRGVPNYRWPELHILSYSKRIQELREDGHSIDCVRDHLPNGHATNIFRYFLRDEDHKDGMQYEPTALPVGHSHGLSRISNLFRAKGHGA